MAARPASAPHLRDVTASLLAEASHAAGEPAWLTDCRLRALDLLKRLDPDQPIVGGAPGLHLGDISVYGSIVSRMPPRVSRLVSARAHSRLRRTLVGQPNTSLVSDGAAEDASALYAWVRQEIARQGVTFTDLASGLGERPDAVRSVLETALGGAENRPRQLLAVALWHGGSYLHVPAGVSVPVPLQPDFLERPGVDGPFSLTMIVAAAHSSMAYIRGCAAAMYVPDPVRCAATLVLADSGATVAHTALQHWSRNVIELVTQWAAVGADATVHWLEGRLGAGVTAGGPALRRMGVGARATWSVVAVATDGQRHEIGAGGAGEVQLQNDVRGVQIGTGTITMATGAALVSDVRTLALSPPHAEGLESPIGIETIDQEMVFALRSRGLSEADALSIAVRAFVGPVLDRFPLEYQVEMDGLLRHRLETPL